MINLYQPRNLGRVLKLLASCICLTVTVGIIRQYEYYFPPNFGTGFLLDRHLHFWNEYWLAFYIHIIATPLALLNGFYLTNDHLRSKSPGVHKALGRVQAIVIILLIGPSGLIMSLYASSGFWAGAGFACQALALMIFTVLGCVYAIRRQFAIHRLWMMRAFLTLCGAIVLRILAAVYAQSGWPQELYYPITAWLCWLLPLATYEALLVFRSNLTLSPR
ncbi:MAG: DUF2306 domain-containing protein [Planctomycetota bacterium]|nr:DUF2306 domain-containing protein [Planctomycetota bacterium]